MICCDICKKVIKDHNTQSEHVCQLCKNHKLKTHNEFKGEWVGWLMNLIIIDFINNKYKYFNDPYDEVKSDQKWNDIHKLTIRDNNTFYMQLECGTTHIKGIINGSIIIGQCISGSRRYTFRTFILNRKV